MLQLVHQQKLIKRGLGNGEKDNVIRMITRRPRKMPADHEHNRLGGGKLLFWVSQQGDEMG